MNEPGSTDCIVIGAGLLGLLTARTLNEAGMQVVLVERAAVCGEASWAGGGILSPLVPWEYPDAVSVLVGWSQHYYPGLASELRDETGIDVQWQRSGLLFAGTETSPQIEAWAQTHDCRLECLDAEQARTLEPALAAGLGPALLLPDVAQIRNPLLGSALRASLLQRGVGLREHTEATGLLCHREEVRGICTATGEIYAPRVVVAAGAWSAHILQGTGVDLQVTPVRGQMIQFQARPGLLRHIVQYRGHYVIPRNDGLILAGSTLEHSGFDKTVTAEAREELTRRSLALVPALSGFRVVRQWAGLRPGTRDGVPKIGEHPAIRGLYLNTGHYRNGVVMAPASARLLADQMLGRKSIADSSPYTL
jgi:glycine oxidase